MNVWPKIKSLALLLLVSLALNASIHLSLRLPYILTYVGTETSLGHNMLIHLMQEVIAATLVSALIPALFLLFNYRLTAWGALVICVMSSTRISPVVALGQLLVLFWILMAMLWLAWNKLRDLYHYCRAK